MRTLLSIAWARPSSACGQPVIPCRRALGGTARSAGLARSRQERKAAVNGIEMYYAVYGTAPGTPVLLIHGGLGYADIWANQVADLAKDHTVIVADSRGTAGRPAMPIPMATA